MLAGTTRYKIKAKIIILMPIDLRASVFLLAKRDSNIRSKAKGIRYLKEIMPLDAAKYFSKRIEEYRKTEYSLTSASFSAIGVPASPGNSVIAAAEAVALTVMLWTVAFFLSSEVIELSTIFIEDIVSDIKIETTIRTIKIIEYAQKYNLRCNIDISTKVISNSRLVNQEILDKIGQAYEIRNDLLEYCINNKIESISFSLIGDEETLSKLRKELIAIEELEVTDLCKSLDIKGNEREVVTYIDVGSKGATKKNAIKLLSNHLNIKKDEIIVIGDGGNDIPMFEVAGLKVAMSNSLDIVKEKADYITGNNNESGVAKAIKKFILNENFQ